MSCSDLGRKVLGVCGAVAKTTETAQNDSKTQICLREIRDKKCLFGLPIQGLYGLCSE